VHVRLKALWNYEAPEGGDTHVAIVRGAARGSRSSRGRAEVAPELYVVPNRLPEALRSGRGCAPSRRAGENTSRPHRRGRGGLRVGIPDRYRVGHEPHFAEVTERFLGYLKDPASLPKWEKANMLAKYWVTTKAVEMCR
jgi:hypothetical protein